MKTAVAYFSTKGVTEGLAKDIASLVQGDCYEIKPAVPYTDADLDWRDLSSRSSKEMQDPSSRPALAPSDFDASAYDTVYVGFPIWWYVAPTIINTFLESYDFSGKTIILFATSGSSGFGETKTKLIPSAPNATIKESVCYNKQALQSYTLDSLKASL